MKRKELKEMQRKLGAKRFNRITNNEKEKCLQVYSSLTMFKKEGK